MKKSAIIIFQKNAELGKVKTRLAKDLGDHKALEIYKRLCDFTHEVCRKVEVDKFLYYSSYIPQEKPSFDCYHFQVQRGISLGDRMSNAFSDVFSVGYQEVLIIGTDCAEISPDAIEDAFDQLGKKEVVIGPAEDGGYYLLGMKSYFPQVFKDVNWSTAEVLVQTRANLKSADISYAELAIKSDIDTLEDWERLKSILSPSENE